MIKPSPLFAAAIALLTYAGTARAQNPAAPGSTPAASGAAAAPAAPMLTVTPPAAAVSTPATIPPGAAAGSIPAADSPASGSTAATPSPVLPPAGAPASPAATTTAAAPPPSLDAVNNAKLGDEGEKDGVSPAVLRAEVMLDRLHASPGVIDGRRGENFLHALAVYRKTKGLKPGELDAQVWELLTAESGAPVLMSTVLTDEDVKGPFYPDLPKDYAQLATLPSLGYRSAAQKLGAKFHMGETLLAALNPGIDLAKAGSTIVVADVRPAPLHDKVASIVVDKEKSQVLGYTSHGTLLVSYPATIGSEELPSPSGTYKVKGVAFNPIYYYDPKNFLQGNNHGKLKLPPGPNNPVGSVFIALTKPTYGLHGTPDPAKIDKASSHGCVRMTNWDADELAHLVKRGIVVRFKG